MFEVNQESLLVPKVEQDILSLMEDSMDGGPPSVGSGELPVASPIPSSTPLTKAQKDQLQKVQADIYLGIKKSSETAQKHYRSICF